MKLSDELKQLIKSIDGDFLDYIQSEKLQWIINHIDSLEETVKRLREEIQATKNLNYEAEVTQLNGFHYLQNLEWIYTGKNLEK